MLALAMPASADLWTSSSPGSAVPVERRAAPSLANRAPTPDNGAIDRHGEPPFTLTILVDPACPVSPAVVQDALAFARTHADVDVRQLAPVALPAVYLEDNQGHGARATGRPPLEALWRAVARGSRG
jgi:hypothetical protein